MILFREMYGRQLKPDSYTYNTLLAALSKNPEQSNLLSEVLDSLEASNIEKDIVTYNLLLKIYGQVPTLSVFFFDYKGQKNEKSL
jgi:hypothetical protein